MILFVVYSLGVWWVAWNYRRRWQAFAALVAAAPPIFLSAHFDMWLVKTFFAEDAGWILSFAIAFAGVTILIGLLLAFQPRRRPAYACVLCGYDLRGLVAEPCPECGERDGAPPKLAPPEAPSASLAVQLADRRRLDKRRSNQFSSVTTPAPTTADPTINAQS